MTSPNVAGETSSDESVVVELTEGPWVTLSSLVQNNHLLGTTLWQLVQILWHNRCDIDYRVFWARILCLLCVATINSCFAALDTIFYSQQVRKVSIGHPPIIIIGQPRSGTTLLHNLLSLDEQFVTANTFQVGWASSFLTMERFANCWPLSHALSDKRPMDNIPLQWSLPQEDELAANSLSGGCSPVMAICFLRDWHRHVPSLTWKDASEANFRRWKDALLWFCKKVQYKASPDKTLLLKSPSHTARVQRLRQLFGPDTKFIFVQRHPDEVFESNWRSLVDRYFRPCVALQTFSAKNAQDYVLGHGKILHEAYIQDAKNLSPKHHVRVRFEDIRRDPVAAMESIYNTLGLDGFEQVRPRLQTESKQVELFQPNVFPKMATEAKEVVRAKWDFMFRDLGYCTK